MGSTIYEITDVPENLPCEKCRPGLNIKLMERGFIEGRKIEVDDIRNGVYLVKMLNQYGTVEAMYGLRDYELDRIKKVKV